MKKISVPESVIIENRLYKAGEYNEADMPVQDFDELLRTGFGKITGDIPNESISTLEPQDLFPTEVLEEDLQSPVDIQTFGEFLTKGIKEIRETLPGLTDDNLLTMLAVEVEGKKRKSVIEAIEAEIKKRVEPDADNATGDNAE